MPGSVIAAIPALPALLLGFWLMQTGNTFQGKILSIVAKLRLLPWLDGAQSRGRFSDHVRMSSLRAGGGGAGRVRTWRLRSDHRHCARSCTFLSWIRSCG